MARMNRALALAIATPLLAGCPSTGPSAPSVVPGAITASVQRAAGEGAEAMLVGATWRTGDRYVVDVASETDAHLYVVLLMENGAQEVVAPREEGTTLTVTKGETVRVPIDGWATLEGGCPGTDRLFVVATQRPLTLADTVLYNAIDRIRRFDVPGAPCDDGAPSDDAYANATDETATGTEDERDGTEGTGTASPGDTTEGGDGENAALLEPVPPPPPAPPPGAGLAADAKLFAGRAACIGRPDCAGKRELKSKGTTYVAPFDDLGIAVMELSFSHE